MGPKNHRLRKRAGEGFIVQRDGHKIEKMIIDASIVIQEPRSRSFTRNVTTSSNTYTSHLRAHVAANQLAGRGNHSDINGRAQGFMSCSRFEKSINSLSPDGAMISGKKIDVRRRYSKTFPQLNRSAWKGLYGPSSMTSEKMFSYCKRDEMWVYEPGAI